jgi:hypothetical protein
MGLSEQVLLISETTVHFCPWLEAMKNKTITVYVRIEGRIDGWMMDG